MAYRPMSRPDPFDPPRSSAAPTSLGGRESSELEDGLSLAELATALSAHGGEGLSADLALDLVLNEIVEHARLATGATAAAIALARDDEIVCRATTGANAPDLGVRLEANSGLSGACVQSKKWQRCDDTETDPRVDAEVCRGLGVRSILVFPVVREDKLLGVVEVFAPRPNAFSDREIQTLEALSRSIVNNVDRASDVLAPSAPVFPSSSSSMAAATSATAAEVESVDHLQVDPAQVDAPLPVVDSLSGATTEISKIHPRDHWMTVLTLTVIALALFLGWMMGYVRSPRGPVGTKVKAAVNATALPVQAKPPEGSALSASAAVRAPDRATPASPTTAPVSSQQSGAGVPPVGGLVVYEHGKVIFRTPPQSLRTSAKDTTNQPVMVPSSVADEYLIQRVEPEYPEPAREQHIQGPVVLETLVGKDGAVEKVSTISGDSQLAAAATDAVRQWRFKPFFRNGSPEEFQTQITVSFRLP
ncbi:MAG TPA: TonB family protein [Terriglobales bacterium]|nr:TonB family protein [Terriglobales bacterium]